MASCATAYFFSNFAVVLALWFFSTAYLNDKQDLSYLQSLWGIILGNYELKVRPASRLKDVLAEVVAKGGSTSVILGEETISVNLHWSWKSLLWNLCYKEVSPTIK